MSEPAPAGPESPRAPARPRTCEITPGCKNVARLPAEFENEQTGALESKWCCGDCIKQIMIRRARKDFNTFAELVAVDDETGLPIHQAPIHRRWAALCEEYDRLLIWSHINSGKTTQLSVLRTVWELGNDPTLRFVILSNTSSIATKIVRSIANYIETSQEVHEIFPDLKPDPKGTWTGTELQVIRKTRAKDPSVRAVGVHGSLTSGRVDRLVVDDILDPENTDTDANRKKVKAWYKAVAVGRLTRRAKVLVVGTAYHPKDLLHDLAAQQGWKWVRFPIFDKHGNITWPEHWPADMLALKKAELGPAEFARQLLCRARDDNEARFRQDWIDAAFRRGAGLGFVEDLKGLFPETGELPEGWATFTGVDLGVKKTRKSDETVLYTFAEDPKGNRRLLKIEAGKMTGPDIVDKIVDHHHRYGSLIAVENVAAQDFILQFATAETNVPVVPHTTTKAKRDPLLGVEGLAIELSNGKWIFPEKEKTSPEMVAFETEMLFYSPHTHTGDRLMACYFAREVARKLLGNRSLPLGNVRILGSDRGAPGSQSSEPARPLLARLFDVIKKPGDDNGGN